MNITDLTLQNFRNHTRTTGSWGKHINLISGHNGAGKTNILDGIHFLCMSRSFVATSDQYIVQKGQSGFAISGTFEGNIRSRFDVSCTYSRGEGKKIYVNESPLDRLSDLVGMVPVVTLSPDDKKLTSEGPAERRSFLDSFISQLYPKYLRDLIDYRRIVKQRNRLLSDFRTPPDVMDSFLEPWNAQLVETGSRIIARRTKVLNQFQDYLEQSYTKIARINHQPTFEYKTICEPSENEKEIEQNYQQLIAENAEKEKEREQTIIGPHRDDLVFMLDGLEVRKFGSQGQHRMFALSLKMAQLYFFSDHLEDSPILLLDDVFGDLDPQKVSVFMEMLVAHPGQTFITAANPEPLLPEIPFTNTDNRQFHVSNGKLSEVED